jgi:hypothetical protein
MAQRPECGHGVTVTYMPGFEPAGHHRLIISGIEAF